MSDVSVSQLHRLLKQHTLKITPWRVRILGALVCADAPLSVEQIFKRLKRANIVTIYRTLHTFRDSGLVREIHFKADMPVFFELNLGAHHHHIVCTSCGDIDELSSCDISSVQRISLKQSRKFSTINDHALEFFGVCQTCTKST